MKARQLIEAVINPKKKTLDMIMAVIREVMRKPRAGASQSNC